MPSSKSDKRARERDAFFKIRQERARRSFSLAGERDEGEAVCVAMKTHTSCIPTRKNINNKKIHANAGGNYGGQKLLYSTKQKRQGEKRIEKEEEKNKRDVSTKALMEEGVNASVSVLLGNQTGDTAVQSALVGGFIVATTVTAFVASLRPTEPIPCPVCNGKGGEPCVACCGTGKNNERAQPSAATGGDQNPLGVRTAYGFEDVSQDVARGQRAMGVVGRNPRECRSCLGVGTKLCKACEGTGYVRRM